jgi:CDP-diacylglycerol--glycerol-3-phosphate 3-phosphatidyltransferase
MSDVISPSPAAGPWRSVPVALVALRFSLGPLLFWDAWDGRTGAWFLFGATLAFLSDVFDGVIARRLGVASEGLREADSWVDTIYYLWIAGAVWVAHRPAVEEWAGALGLVAASQLLCWVVDFAKYRRFATYHQYSAKLWGITLFVATLALFGWNYTGWCMGLMVAFGTLSHVEGVAMTLVLPRWTFDVLTIWHAWKLRPGQLAERRAALGPVEAA